MLIEEYGKGYRVEQSLPNLKEFAEELVGLDALGQKSLLNDVLERIGYSSFIFVVYPRRPELLETARMHSIETFPNEWMSFYKSEEFFEHDLMVHHCIERNDPGLWSVLHDKSQMQNHTSKQIEVSDFAWQFGLRYGISIPIGIGSAHVCGISFASHVRISGRLHDKFAVEFERYLIGLAHTFYYYANIGDIFANHLGLNSKDRYLVHRLAESYQMDEIAEELGVSYEKIKQRRLRVGRKLKASDLARTVNTCTELGMFGHRFCPPRTTTFGGDQVGMDFSGFPMVQAPDGFLVPD